MSKNIKKIYLVIFIVLIVFTVSLYIVAEDKNNYLENLTTEKENITKQKKFVNDHQNDLQIIKTLKQEILGQDNKLEEYTKQIANFTDLLIKNQKKLDEME